MSRRWLLLIIGGLVVLSFASFKVISLRRNSFQSIIITNSSGFELSLYAAGDGQEGNGYDKTRLFFSTDSPGSHRLKKGEYAYVVTGPSDYEPLTQRLTLGVSPVRLTIPNLGYTDNKLASLLSTNKPAIQATIQLKYASQMSFYTIQDDKLYGNGEWYGAKLVPSNSNAYDTLRIVLKHTSSGWGIVTNPPEIVISRPVYPNIPGYILTDLNNR
jgi:hypothetical protein